MNGFNAISQMWTTIYLGRLGSYVRSVGGRAAPGLVTGLRMSFVMSHQSDQTKVLYVMLKGSRYAKPGA